MNLSGVGLAFALAADAATIELAHFFALGCAAESKSLLESERFDAV